jgi:hypothetical protein
MGLGVNISYLLALCAILSFTDVVVGVQEPKLHVCETNTCHGLCVLHNQSNNVCCVFYGYSPYSE